VENTADNSCAIISTCMGYCTLLCCEPVTTPLAEVNCQLDLKRLLCCQLDLPLTHELSHELLPARPPARTLPRMSLTQPDAACLAHPKNTLCPTPRLTKLEAP
jgi:hypothetical protein